MPDWAGCDSCFCRFQHDPYSPRSLPAIRQVLSAILCRCWHICPAMFTVAEVYGAQLDRLARKQTRPSCPSRCTKKHFRGSHHADHSHRCPDHPDPRQPGPGVCGYLHPRSPGSAALHGPVQRGAASADGSPQRASHGADWREAAACLSRCRCRDQRHHHQGPGCP